MHVMHLLCRLLNRYFFAMNVLFYTRWTRLDSLLYVLQYLTFEVRS